MRKCTISWTLKGNSWFQWGPVYNIIYVYRCMVEGYIDYVCSLRNHVLPCSWESNTFVLLRRLTYSMFPQNTVSVDLAVWKTKNWCKLKGYSFICSNFLKYPQCRFLVIFTAKYGNFDSPVYYNSSPQQTSKPLYSASVLHMSRLIAHYYWNTPSVLLTITSCHLNIHTLNHYSVKVAIYTWGKYTLVRR